MQLDDWFEHARRDAVRRGLPDLEPLLDMLFGATRALRAADWARTDDIGAAGDREAAGLGSDASSDPAGAPPATPGIRR